ncbi:MAG: hypothetical protein QOC70_852 [Verrucomicrobiota bacterium]
MKRLLLLLSLALCAKALASDPTADATAKFLAGLPVKGTPLESHSNNPEWAEHATDLGRAWERLEKEQLSKIRAWAPKTLGPAYEDRGSMYYMFSGPDFLYANIFFPNASTYILCGIEPVGPLPDIDKIPSADLASALTGLRKSLSSVLNESYFITKYMRTDFKQTQLTGTLPIFYVFLARAGCTVASVTPVALDRDGKFVPAGPETTPGVKIVFSNPSKREQTLYYFTSDLGDKAVKANPGFSNFCERQGQGLSLLKAACNYMGTNNFTMVRGFLLTHSKILLQDESGIPYSFVEPEKWNIRLFAKPHAQDKPVRLDFSFGYKEQSCSSVMVATPK